MELVLPRTRSYSSTGLVPYGHSSCRELYELVLGKTQFHDIEFLEKIHSLLFDFLNWLQGGHKSENAIFTPTLPIGI